MFNTEAKCRQQEAHQRQFAAMATLPNVRRIALAAAEAWAIQAVEAARHEAGAMGTLSAEDAAIALEFLREEQEGVEDLEGDQSREGP